MLNYVKLSEFLLEEVDCEIALTLGELPSDELARVDLPTIEFFIAEFMADSIRTDLLHESIQAVISEIFLATLLREG